MSTKNILRQQPTANDAENGIYPSIPMQNMGHRSSRPPPLRQDTVDMEVVPLNRTLSQQETEDRSRVQEIFYRYDVNLDGYISTRELKDLINAGACYDISAITKTCEKGGKCRSTRDVVGIGCRFY